MNVNKYHKWYEQLIDRARNRTIEGYVERHHIVPKSLGGTNEKSNLVKLTAREHLIAHMLLPRFVENKVPMWNALWGMIHMNKVKLTGRLYEQVKAKISADRKGRKLSPEARAKLSAAHKGKKLSPETIAKMSASHKGKKHSTGRKVSLETRAKISAAKKGRKMSPESIAKMSASLKGKKLSPETRAKLSAANKGRKRSPHTPETIAKMSAAHKGKKFSPETIAKRVATRARLLLFRNGSG